MSVQAWVRHHLPYASRTYAHFPVTLAKRVLLRPHRAGGDPWVRRFRQQWGWLPREVQPAGGVRPVWVHMSSGGEAVMAQPLISRLLSEGQACILSSDSFDAQALLRRASDAAPVFFPPWDTSVPIRRFLNRLRPSLLVFVANVYLPQLVWEARRRRVPAVLVNGVLTRQVQAANPLLRRALGLRFERGLEGIAVQSEADREAFLSLGVAPQKLAVTGKLEGDLRAFRLSSDARAGLRRSLGLEGGEPVWVAGSVPPGEGELLMRVHRAVRERVPSARLVVAPRWLHDVELFLRAAEAAGLRAVRRTASQERAAEVTVVDTFGELRRLYGIGDCAFIGSSLRPINERKGGHNILEPLAHGLPVFFGPAMNLWREVTEALKSAWPFLEVPSADALAERVSAVLRGEPVPEAYRRQASRITGRESGATERTLAFLKPRLKPCSIIKDS